MWWFLFFVFLAAFALSKEKNPLKFLFVNLPGCLLFVVLVPFVLLSAGSGHRLSRETRVAEVRAW